MLLVTSLSMFFTNPRHEYMQLIRIMIGDTQNFIFKIAFLVYNVCKFGWQFLMYFWSVAVVRSEVGNILVLVIKILGIDVPQNLFPKSSSKPYFFRAVPHGIVISLFQRELICHLSSHKSTDITCFKYQLGLKFYFGKTRNWRAYLSSYTPWESNFR